MEFFRQEYWSGLPFSSPGVLPNPRIEPASPAFAGKFFTEPPGKPPYSREDWFFWVSAVQPAGSVPWKRTFHEQHVLWSLASLVAQRLKRLPAMQETWIQSGGSSGEGNGNPLQYSCLRNPMDGGAWWATVHGVSTSRTGLECLHFFTLTSAMVEKLYCWVEVNMKHGNRLLQGEGFLVGMESWTRA